MARRRRPEEVCPAEEIVVPAHLTGPCYVEQWVTPEEIEAGVEPWRLSGARTEAERLDRIKWHWIFTARHRRSDAARAFRELHGVGMDAVPESRPEWRGAPPK